MLLLLLIMLLPLLLITSAKEIMQHATVVCLFVCLFVHGITEKFVAVHWFLVNYRLGDRKGILSKKNLVIPKVLPMGAQHNLENGSFCLKGPFFPHISPG